MTAQCTDYIVYEGERLALLCNPLGSYEGPSQARLHFIPPHTANWQGYIATWQIIDDELYLVDIEGQLADKTQGTIALFSEVDENGRVKATWVSGDLRIAKGDVVQYVHMGYESRFEQELFLRVEGGSVTSSQWITPSAEPPLEP